LNIDKQIREDHHAHLTVQVEADRLEGMKRRAASQLAKRVKIAGFRPGKAPYPVIVRQLGEAAILEEAIELLVDDVYPEVIKEADIKPYGPGKLENISSADPVTLEFSVPLEAETILGDYHTISKAYEPEAVSDQDITDVMQDLRERHAIVEPVDRPAQVGDQITLKLSATQLGSNETENKELFPERSSSIIIKPVETGQQEEAEKETASDNKAEEWPFPGFSHQLIGLRASEKKSFEYTYPEDSEYQALQGTRALFDIQVEAVKSRQLPELDDEFAKSMGEYDSISELQEDVRKSLEAQARAAYNENYDEEILEAAIEQTTYKYPEEMVEHEIDTVISEFRRRLERQGMDLDLYLKTRNLDMNGFKDEVRPVAEGRIKRALFLVEFGRAENIEVKPEELEKEAYSTMDYLYSTLPEKDARKLSERDIYTNIVGNVLADMLSRRSLERFREISSGGLSTLSTEDEVQEGTETGEENFVNVEVEDDKIATIINDASTEKTSVPSSEVEE
jgi:trigger factor